MALLRTNVWVVVVRNALLAGEPPKFMNNMRRDTAKEALYLWENWRQAEAQLVNFNGWKEEGEVVMDYAQGKRILLRKRA
jgi:hypothetical protein